MRGKANGAFLAMGPDATTRRSCRAEGDYARPLMPLIGHANERRRMPLTRVSARTTRSKR